MYKFKREKQISFTDFKQRIAMLGGARLQGNCKLSKSVTQALWKLRTPVGVKS